MNKNSDSNPQPLVEGVDYTIESGLLVFTAAYHHRRGNCCNSGCRHCPWRTLRDYHADDVRNESK